MTKTDVIIATAESYGFKYKIHITVDDLTSDITFDVFDKIMLNGELSDQVIISGKIDIYGRCDLTGRCDIFAALSMGEIMKVVYEEISEITIRKEDERKGYS